MQKRIIQLLSRATKGVSASPATQQKLSSLFRWLAARPGSRKLLFRLFGKYTWHYLMLARTQRSQGDDRGAFHTLMMGQRCAADDYRIHIKLSELYRDNGDVRAAHTHLKLADVLKPGYSTIRLLTFETDHHMLEEGSMTMARILEYPSRLIQRHIPMLNRISIYYPEHREKLNAAREELWDSLQADSYPNPVDLSNAVDKAISNRWLRVALDISRNRTEELRPPTRQLLNRLAGDLGAYEAMLELAWKNEVSDEIAALVQGRTIPLNELDKESGRIVELFIPTPFFAGSDNEKPTYETIRLTFVHTIRYLLERDDIIVIPRYQLYWRDCIPRTREARVISYHTNAPANPLRLHIQESPLAGCSSFDNSGFAGFSSIATDHAQIARFVSDVPAGILEQNQLEMHDRYVAANISKYLQPTDSKPIPGPYVFVALQIPTDIVSRLAWISGTDLLRGVVDHYRGTGVSVVVKRHPFCGSMGVQGCLDELEAAGDIIRTNNSIHSLIASAQCVITVNSGVGLEALIHGKSVIVSGQCDYTYAARTVRNRDELVQTLSGDISPDERRIRELLYYYVRRFTVPATDAERIRARLEEWLA